MEDLGKISIVPKGDYSEKESYEILDLVNHGSASWLCKKDCTGQEPSESNTEFWQIFGSAVDMSNIDAKTLDGHKPEYFAKFSDFANHQLTQKRFNTESEIDAYYDSLHSNAKDNSVYQGWIANGVSHSILGGGQFYVWGARTTDKYGWQKTIGYNNGVSEYERSMVNGVWSKWEMVFTTNGGTITGDLELASDNAVNKVYRMRNAKRNIGFIVRDDGSHYVYDDTNYKMIYMSEPNGANTWYGRASECLSCMGGDLGSGKGAFPVFFKGDSAQCYAEFGDLNRNHWGLLGFEGKDKPSFINGDRTVRYDLLHTGNFTDYAAEEESGTFTLKIGNIDIGTGTYCKVGKLVYCYASNQMPDAIEQGSYYLSGFPFAIKSGNGSFVDLHFNQVVGNRGSNLILDVTETTMTFVTNELVQKNQPYTFSAVYITE